ncbi:MAG: four helix bundle protein [Bacteroidales bacterium]|nr:four helix bundle protein [Bacteroidales bacterium]
MDILEEQKANYHDLQERLINFAVEIFKLSDKIVNTVAGRRMTDQIVRSGSSPALNYAEASDSSSLKDFIYRCSIVLRELRETWVSLKIIEKSNLAPNYSRISEIKKECNELISIFVSSIRTAKKRMNKEKT